MRIFSLGIVVLLAACAPTSRLLSEEEKAKHGLSGVIYDARLCPIKNGRPVGQCELVTCEPKDSRSSNVECRAKPEPGREKISH